MRLLYAVHAYKPAYRVGGPVLSVSAAAERLVRKGHRVVVFTTNSNLDEDLDVPIGRPVDVDGVEVWYFKREEPLQRWFPFIPYLSRSLGFLYCPGMKDALDRVVPEVDAVDTHMPFVYPTYAAARAAFRHGRPLFYHQRGNFHPARLRFRGMKKRAYIAAIEKPIMRRSTTLIALTEAERHAFRALGIRTPCEVIPNGIDVPPERAGAAERIESRFGIRRDAPVVLFLGRLHPIKGADIIIEAFVAAADRLNDAVLVMAGPDEWNLVASWKQKIATLGLSDRIRFTGMLTGADKEDMLERADLFCLPSVGEGFSMAILEALAHRTAVMLSPGCNFPEVVEASAGLVVPAERQPMSDALASILHDRDRLRTMGAAARRLAAERYSWDVISERLAETYSEGIARFSAAKRVARASGTGESRA